MISVTRFNGRGPDYWNTAFSPSQHTCLYLFGARDFHIRPISLFRFLWDTAPIYSLLFDGIEVRHPASGHLPARSLASSMPEAQLSRSVSGLEGR